MKLRLVAAVLVCVVLATGAWAQWAGGISPRAAGMGGAAIGVADDAHAFYQNPAGLAALAVPVREGAEYGNDAMFSYANISDENNWGVALSGWKPEGNFGYGAGYADPTSVSTIFGVGFGAGFSNIPLSAGINLLKIDQFVADYPYPYPVQIGGFHNTTNLLNAGLMYRISQGEGKDPIRLGFTVQDLGDEFVNGPFYNAGLGWKPVKNLLVAVDATDLSDEAETGVLVSGGVEYAFNSGPQTWFGRAGLMDNGDEHKATVGAGYKCGNWRADFAWIDTDPDAVWTFGVGVNM